MRKNITVAGTSYEGRDRIIRSHCKNGAVVFLKRDPRNKFDENAIAVYLRVPILFGLLGSIQRQIGFVKTSAAKNLAKKMDSGVQISGVVDSFYAPKGKKAPRVSVEISDE